MTMKLAVAVQIDAAQAVAAAALFDDWDAREATRCVTTRMPVGDKPPRGTADPRPVACIVQLLREHALQPGVIVMEAPVHLDAAETPGLGRQLYDALGGTVAVVGVTKTTMPGMPAQFEVAREEEARPVIVTCAGIDLGAAKVRVRSMHGKRRVPTLLKLAARMVRGEMA